MDTPDFRALRKRRRWSVAQLAALTGIGQATIKFAEKGGGVSPATALCLLAALKGEGEREPASRRRTADTPQLKPRRPRGFAAMDPAHQRAIAGMGGRAAHKSGRAHQWSSEEARAAGRKSGCRDKERMRALGDAGREARRKNSTSRAADRRAEQDTQPGKSQEKK